MEEEKKTPEREEEQALPVQELPTDIPAEVRQKLAEDLNEQATEDLKQDVREAEKEEANDEEVKANPEMLTKSRLLKLLVKKQYVKLREVTEEEQPADLAELLEELDENNRLVVFRLLKKDVATEAFAYMSDEARDDLVNAFSDVELVSAIEDMSLDDAHGIDFLDMNIPNDRYQADFARDFQDKANHYNVYGAEKATRYLGRYLTEKFGDKLTDRRTDEKY